MNIGTRWKSLPAVSCMVGWLVGSLVTQTAIGDYVVSPTPESGVLGIEDKGADKNPYYGAPVEKLDYGCYERTFSDEFNSHSISTSPSLGKAKYRSQYYWGDDSINNELQYYADPKVHHVEVISVHDGKLYIAARKLENPLTSSKGKKYSIASGMISTQGTFSQAYGLFEIRAKLPKGKGLWPAFWLLPENAKKWHERGYSRMPEIDVMEQIGDKMNIWYATMHTRTPPYDGGFGKGMRIYGTRIRTRDDLSKGFHVYSVDIRDKDIVWYFDGTPVKHEPIPKDFRNDPKYLILNLAVGGSWPGPPDQNTRFPARYVVDYIRVFKRKASCNASGGKGRNMSPPASPVLEHIYK